MRTQTKKKGKVLVLLEVVALPYLLLKRWISHQSMAISLRITGKSIVVEGLLSMSGVVAFLGFFSALRCWLQTMASSALQPFDQELTPTYPSILTISDYRAAEMASWGFTCRPLNSSSSQAHC